MGIVCKLFIQSAVESPQGDLTYQLGAVCRGETNKEWAAATPSGTLKCHDDDDHVLSSAWSHRPNANLEVLVHVQPDPNGTWQLDSCGFTYGGCQVKFRQADAPWGTLDLTINAQEATKQLRQQFADGLMAGTPPKFCLIVRPVNE